MKRLTLRLAFPLLTAAAHAQSYSITSRIIAGGGGTSSGGAYAVTGAIAQPEASPPSTGGGYGISGGFFGQYMALQQTGAPHLTIRSVGGNVQVVWGSNVPGWVLQANNTDLAPENWLDVAGTPTVMGAEQFLQFAAGGGRVFFRLRKL
ncbi:MAG TPA: hypothetical protein DIT64_08295 [Verrucomicrobiales bacterium]|nr:hypothetical protein [Verrucomicrobiales bacterium]